MLPADVEALHDDLRAAYARAWAEIKAQQAAIERELPKLLNKPQRLARLRALERTIESQMTTLDRHATAWCKTELPKAYAAGALAVDGSFVWSSAHLAAVSQLASDTHSDLLAATRYVRASVKRLIRAVAADRNVAALLASKTATQSAREATKLIRTFGVHSVVYKDGSRRALDDYVEMAVRSKTAIAYNAGTVNYGEQVGVEWFEIFDGPSCGWLRHDDLELANGKIVRAPEALANPISHPRCQRSYSARPDLGRHANVADAPRFQTPAQQADAAAAELARQGAQDARRARAAARAGRRAPASYAARTRRLRAARAARAVR